jgi:hypothetical protein
MEGSSRSSAMGTWRDGVGWVEDGHGGRDGSLFRVRAREDGHGVGFVQP